MPMPWTYRHASREFRAFLADAKDRMALVSDNSTYTAIDAVFQVFRRRVTVEEGLAFASVLPSVPRAIFVANWSPRPPVPFADRATLIAEVQAVRRDHNLTPENAIEAVAWSVRRHVRQDALDRVLAGMAPEAADYWRVDVADPRELERRIV